MGIRVYWQYILHVGLLSTLIAVGFCAAGQSFFFVVEWWVADWASSSSEDQRNMDWVWNLAVFTGVGSIIYMAGSFSIFILFIMGSTRLHGHMIRRVLTAPLKFFHTNPTGRILNRFSKDLGLQDEELTYLFADVFLVRL